MLHNGKPVAISFIIDYASSVAPDLADGKIKFMIYEVQNTNSDNMANSTCPDRYKKNLAWKNFFIRDLHSKDWSYVIDLPHTLIADKAEQRCMLSLVEILSNSMPRHKVKFQKYDPNIGNEDFYRRVMEFYQDCGRNVVIKSKGSLGYCNQFYKANRFADFSRNVIIDPPGDVGASVIEEISMPSYQVNVSSSGASCNEGAHFRDLVLYDTESKTVKTYGVNKIMLNLTQSTDVHDQEAKKEVTQYFDVKLDAHGEAQYFGESDYLTDRDKRISKNSLFHEQKKSVFSNVGQAIEEYLNYFGADISTHLQTKFKLSDGLLGTKKHEGVEGMALRFAKYCCYSTNSEYWFIFRRFSENKPLTKPFLNSNNFISTSDYDNYLKEHRKKFPIYYGS